MHNYFKELHLAQAQVPLVQYHHPQSHHECLSPTHRAALQYGPWSIVLTNYNL